MKVCVYHGSDLDGKCCAAIYLSANPGTDKYHLVPMDYGDAIPWEMFKGADVTLMDFSLQPWSQFDRLLKEANSVVWIDHHRSAIESYEQSETTGTWCPLDTVLDEKKAACELAWEYYHPEEPIPFGVCMLGRYDVWDHADPRVMPYQYGVRLLDMEPRSQNWTPVLTTSAADPWHKQRIHDGEMILKYQREKDAAAVGKAWFPLQWAGYKWQACNILGRGSTFFDSVWRPEDYDGMLSFFWSDMRWEVGLYTDNQEIDCGAIAKVNGGGGHPGAAGFRCDKLPFDLPGDILVRPKEELTSAKT